MVLFNTLRFLKKQWFGSILIVVLILSVFLYQSNRSNLIEEANKLELKIKVLKNKDKENQKLIDSLKQVDTLIVDRIKVIKRTEYEKIIVIDSMSITKLQQFFTNRYADKK